MAKNTKRSKKEKVERKNYKNNSDPTVICQQYKKAYDFYEDTRKDWDEKEAILIGQNYNSSASKSRNLAKSQVFDPRLSTIIFERMMRVMSQLQSGKARYIGKKDKGKTQLMNLVLNNYVEPKARTQMPMLTKWRLENMYSHVYGAFGHIVDYRVNDDGYIGPDFMLKGARHIVNQPNKYTIQDAQYTFVGDWISKEVIKGWKNGDKWQNIDELLEKSKGDKSHLSDLDGKSYIENKYGDNSYAEHKEKYQHIYIVTRYENDRWITFAPDYNVIIRDIENPHLNGKKPVVMKQSIPLIDRFFGLGEIERGKTLQYALNTLWNLYLDGSKFSIFPPKLVNLANVVPSTILNQPAANWVVKDINNSIKEFNVSPSGLNTFQSTYSTLVAGMLNMAGTTDTTVSSATDPGLGKTPQALALLSQRQNARDTFDREMQEEAIKETYDIFLDLLSIKQEKPIKLSVFEEELQMIAKTNPDVLDMFESGEGAEIIIKPNDLKGNENGKFEYYIDKGSTYKKDELLQKQEVTEHLGLALKLSDPQELRQTGKVRIGDSVIDVAELYKRSLISGGTQDWDKIIYEEEVQPEMPQDRMQEPMQGAIPQVDPQTGLPMQAQQPMQGEQTPANFEDPDIQAAFEEIMGGR